MFGLVEKKHEKTNIRVTGVDPLGNPMYAWDWKTSRVYNTKAVVALMAMVMVIIGSFAAAIIVTMGGEKSIPATSVVVEGVKTTEVAQKYTYGPAYVKADKYVCDVAVTSNEYQLTEIFTGYNESQVDWHDVANRNIVFEWRAGEMLRPSFEKAVALFADYTRANVRVEAAGYVAVNGEYLIPVSMKELEGAAAAVWHSYDPRNLEDSRDQDGMMVTTGSLVVAATSVEVDPMMESDFMGEDGRLNVFLHELGHIVGLDHTHEEDGIQNDSIMSYESDVNIAYYLPGDIAGLKEVFC